MEAPFIYDRYVTGKHFIGRRDSCTILGNLLSHGEHVYLCSPPKTGKKSLIQQTFFNLRISSQQFVIGEFSLLNIRSLSSFLVRLGSTAIRTVATTPAEYADLVHRFLDGTHFVFDPVQFARADEAISLNWEPDENDLLEMLRFPWRIAQDRSTTLYLILSEFQNIDLTDEGDRICKAMEKVIKEMHTAANTSCSLLLCGSKINAMNDIFEVRRHFYRLVEPFPLKSVDEKDIIEHIIKGFLSSGKVVERNLLLGMCHLFRNHLGYIYHFTAVCDSLSKGYINEATLMDALASIISLHEPHFMDIMNDLTTYQVNMLRAVVDGHKRFSSSEIIRAYSLSSSANVRRLKDALMKKEIITFGEDNEPRIIDPLFDYWVRRYYFEIKSQP